MSVESQKEPDSETPCGTQLSTVNSQLSLPPERVEFPKLLLALVIVLASAALLALHIQSFFADKKYEGVMISAGLREHLKKSLLPPDLPLAELIIACSTVSVGVWLVGATALALVSWTSWRTMLWTWASRFLWLAPLGLYEALWAICPTTAREGQVDWLMLLLACLPFFHTVAWGGLVASALGLMIPTDRMPGFRRVLAHPAVVWVAAAIYTGTFATMSVLQYRTLMVPHGDTAMYEEHLWNLLHGKGFRSQLDGGRLFFGEHLEVIHLLLLPVYVLFPSLPALNICLTIGLASGAVAVRGITRRLTGSDGAANWLAIAHLCYFPLQYLNLEISLKTFRPENFGVPLLLFAIWSLEANRLRTMLVLLGLTLLCKEDYAFPVAMIGLFLALRRGSEYCTRNSRLLGVGIFTLAVVFLWFVLDVFIPHFRGGSPPHYMAYYPELGNTPLEIVANVVRRPSLLAKPLLKADNLIFVLLFVVPLAGLPLVGVGRLWLLLPTLASILLIQLDDARSPFFHFHAPLVPVLFWAAAEGLGRMRKAEGGRRKAEDGGRKAEGGTTAPASNRLVRQFRLPPSAFHLPPSLAFARFATACALVSGIWSGKSPLSVAFYDGHTYTRAFGRVLYAPWPNSPEQVRVQYFEKLFALIPSDARVAATDFVRPRFTHHRECHQYGEGGLKPHVKPESIDYIVIDLTGPYGDWVQGHRLRELDEDPAHWEVMHWDPIGELFFHVIRAKREPESVSGEW